VQVVPREIDGEELWSHTCICVIPPHDKQEPDGHAMNIDTVACGFEPLEVEEEDAPYEEEDEEEEAATGEEAAAGEEGVAGEEGAEAAAEGEAPAAAEEAPAEEAPKAE